MLPLVGGFNPSEKYQSVGMIIPNICKNNKCSKPPTRPGVDFQGIPGQTQPVQDPFLFHLWDDIYAWVNTVNSKWVSLKLLQELQTLHVKFQKIMKPVNYQNLGHPNIAEKNGKQTTTLVSMTAYQLLVGTSHFTVCQSWMGGGQRSGGGQPNPPVMISQDRGTLS